MRVRHRFLYWTLALALLLISWIAFFLFREISPDKFFSETLEEYSIIERVRVGNESYDVAFGIVRHEGTEVAGDRALLALRLAYAITLARRTPLFSLEGTDTGSLSRAIDELDNVRRVLAGTATRPEDAVLIETSLYPIRFLRSVVSLEESRKTFLASGSDVDEQKYRQSLNYTLSAFEQDLESYRQAFAHFVPPEIPAEYVLLSGTITSESVLAAIDALKESGEAAKVALARRDSCLEGLIDECKPPDLFIPLFSSDEKMSHVSLMIPPLVEEIVSMRSAAIGDSENAQEESVVELLEKTCPPYSAGPYYFVQGRQEEARGPASFFANDLFFYRSEDFKDTPGAVMMRYFAGKNVSFVFLPTTAFYTCPETGSDLGLIAAVTAVVDFAGKNRGVAPVAEETLLSSSRIVRERDARAYVNEAIKKARPGNVANDLAALALMLKDRSAGFDMLVGEIAAFGGNDVRMKKAGIPVDITPEYLFLTRSGFLALFMGHNRSLVGERDIRVLKEKTGPSGKNVYRWSQLRSKVPKEKIIKDLRIFITSHMSPEKLEE